jgi:hypothetical protein
VPREGIDHFLVTRELVAVRLFPAGRFLAAVGWDAAAGVTDFFDFDEAGFDFGEAGFVAGGAAALAFRRFPPKAFSQPSAYFRVVPTRVIVTSGCLAFLIDKRT